MKKYLTLLLIIIFIFSLVSCDTSKISIVVENECLDFRYHTISPNIFLDTKEELIQIDDDELFYKLVFAITGQQVTYHDNCECQPIYSLKIQEYRFSLFEHGILVKQSAGKNVKHVIYIGFVECEKTYMDELFSIIEEFILDNNLN